MSAEARILYFVDPMCSWCWGFAPVVTALAQKMPLHVVAGGLRVNETRPITADIRETLHGHWQKVAAMTDQSFQYEGNLPNGFVYNSGAACHALVVGRELAPEKTLSWLHRLQQAFYAEAVDVTSSAELKRLAADHGIDGFAEAFESAAMQEKTEADFDRRYESAVTGFPTLLLERDCRLKRVCQGYAALEDITARLRQLGVSV